MKAERTLKEIKPRGQFIKSLIKGSLMALSISLIAICIFAFVLRFCDISADAIKPINQVIKIVSILIGAFYALKKNKEMGLITGFLIGILYTILAFIVFSILNGGFSFQASLINDLIFGGIAGGIAGIVAVNFRKK
ncbi:MAG: TIGR04086 family membrane protein [Clostridiales bacterium]|nr:TIGR04086 family membrane protein [Clostridiales bacterium]